MLEYPYHQSLSEQNFQTASLDGVLFDLETSLLRGFKEANHLIKNKNVERGPVFFTKSFKAFFV
jgi:hypothetical protein